MALIALFCKDSLFILRCSFLFLTSIILPREGVDRLAQSHASNAIQKFSSKLHLFYETNFFAPFRCQGGKDGNLK